MALCDRDHVGKHLRYSEVKHADKFAETLAALWHKGEPYIIRVGIALVALTLIVGVWLIVSGLFAGPGDTSWEARFRAVEEARRTAPRDPEAAGAAVLARMEDFAAERRGEPAAAITLLELAQGRLRRAASLGEDRPKAAREEVERAANAAEQFVADFPEHRHVALAHYEAGKARMELGEWERAAEHFEKAAASPLRALAALVKWHAGYCYERLGRVAQARLKYEELRVDPRAGWCAEQAEFALARLSAQPPKDPQRNSGAQGGPGAQEKPGAMAPPLPKPAPPK